MESSLRSSVTLVKYGYARFTSICMVGQVTGIQFAFKHVFYFEVKNEM